MTKWLGFLWFASPPSFWGGRGGIGWIVRLWFWFFHLYIHACTSYDSTIFCIYDSYIFRHTVVYTFNIKAVYIDRWIPWSAWYSICSGMSGTNSLKTLRVCRFSFVNHLRKPRFFWSTLLHVPLACKDVRQSDARKTIDGFMPLYVSIQ